jgi:hypothetical protein
VTGAPHYGPPVDGDGRVPGIDVGPGDLDEPPEDVLIRMSLDASITGLYPSLLLIEAQPGGEVRSYHLSRDELPDLGLMSWRTRAILRPMLLRLLHALDEARSSTTRV